MKFQMRRLHHKTYFKNWEEDDSSKANGRFDMFRNQQVGHFTVTDGSEGVELESVKRFAYKLVRA